MNNKECLWAKGTKIPDQVDEEGEKIKEKPARVPRAPSPEPENPPEKRVNRNKRKKKGDTTKPGLPTY